MAEGENNRVEVHVGLATLRRSVVLCCTLSPLLSNRLKRLVVVLDDLRHQFQELLAGSPEDFAATRGGSVVFSSPAAHHFLMASQVAEPLQQVERRDKASPG